MWSLIAQRSVSTVLRGPVVQARSFVKAARRATKCVPIDALSQIRRNENITGANKMSDRMSDKMAFLLFGDQSLDTHDFLAGICQRGNLSVLSRSFLEKVSSALREEVDELPKLERQRVPKFSSIQELNKRYHAGAIKNSAVDSVLLCITQLAHYIHRAEKRHEDSTIPSETCLVGLCTGLFAATAIASSPSVSELVPIGVQTVLMAFRTGKYVAALADHLQKNSESSESWTYVLPGAGETGAAVKIKEFHQANGTPHASQAYISAITPSSIAISGPPSTLKALFNSVDFKEKPMPVPVHGPYHAAHLHSNLNIESIMLLKDAGVQHVLGHFKPRSPVMSCTAGTWYSEPNGISLIKAVIADILTKPLQFQKVLHGCVVKAQSYRGTRCLVIPFGPTHAANNLSTMLKSQTDLEIVLRRSVLAKGESDSTNNETHAETERYKLAIVGMAGRFPDAANHQELWDLLERGLDVHKEVPKDRFDVKAHTDPTGKGRNTSHTPYGCWIKDPGLFDPRFFNMSPREAFQTDPMQRLALTTAYEALEMAGYVPNRTSSTKLDRIGTFYGQTSDDWREINAAQDVDTYFITGGVRAFGPGRINYYFGFSGPSFSIDTACSSSAAAIQLACTSLWAGDCDTAIVGGLSCMTNPDIFAGLSRGQFLSKTGPCATFDNDADGYCRADGVGTVIIKRLDYALADKDNVLAVILGSATNHCADAISITHPHGGTQEILYRSILDRAGIDPRDVDYVEMHGTGTQAGDGTEMRSVTNVFAPADHIRSAEKPLYLGAVKANVGHGEAASGVTALIKCLLMMQKNGIPPHVGIKNTINKGFPKDLADRNVHIAFHKTPFLRKAGAPRRIFVNNFSAAGGNTGLLLEDAVIPKPAIVDPRSTHVVTVTARSKSALVRNAERLIEYLEQNPKTDLADLAYTTTARRIQHNWRLAVTGSDIAQVQADLRSRLSKQSVPVLPEAPRAVFLFTGQGSHYPAMGRELYECSTLFRESIVEFDKIATIHGFPSFIPLIDGSVADVQTLSPVIVQVGLVCFEIAITRLWASWGVTPSVVIGHSLGEYAALNVSGVLTVSDTIYLVGTRAQLLVEKCTAGSHVMLAVQGSVGSVTEALKGEANTPNIACINSPRETVLSGEAAEISGAADKLGKLGFKCTQLKVPFAFHSAQVDPILAEFEKLAGSIHFGKPKIPIISSLLGRPLAESEEISPTYLRKHAREPVNFLGGLLSAQQVGITDEQTVWLEVGPHPICLGMVKAVTGGVFLATPTLRRNESAYQTISSSLSALHTAGFNIDWNEYHRDFHDSVNLLELPSYAFDDKNYWIQYEGDWCLTKGRLSAQESVAAQEDSKPKLSTTTVHTVTSEVVEGDTAVVSIESDLARADLRGVVTGHIVNGAMLCPSSLYADMAITLCDYAYKLIRPEATNLGINVANMNVPKSLIARDDGKSQIIKLTATLNVAIGRADLVFSSESGKTKVEHATCQVFFGDCDEWLSEWQRSTYLIQSRIDWLKEAERSGKAHKIGRGLAYKLFSALVDYDAKYRGMEEVILHSDNMEATSQVVFQTSEKDGDFMCSPYWIDSVAHISGFIVNGSDAIDSRENVYISHGWESLRVAEMFSAEKTYRSYVKMQPRSGKIMAGDVFVFDQDRVVAVVANLKFQCIPRKVLDMLLPPVGAAAMAKATAPVRQTSSIAPPKASRSRVIESTQVSLDNIGAVNKKLLSIPAQALEILAEEIGVGIDELVDNIAFADLGVDSLMSLTVSGRLREQLEIDVHSHDFNDHATIGSFKTFLARFERKRSESSDSLSAPATLNQSTPNLMEDSSNATTPLEESASGGSREGTLSDIIRTTIAEEMGVETDEIAGALDLASIGMDSLMSLSILGRLREQTGLSLPADFFLTNRSVYDVERSLEPAQPKSTKAFKLESRMGDAAAAATAAALAAPRLASSDLLQGNLRKASKVLWMIPDGGGSATSYVGIPALSPQVAVFGLNSPYMKVPEEYSSGGEQDDDGGGGVVGMAAAFIREMRRRQPVGPYLLAGWSAGGVIAFEVAQQLTRVDETVEKLILIDSPCPDIIEPLPSSLHRWFASIGLLGDGENDSSKLPTWLLPHFAASVRALSCYAPVSIAPAKCPSVTAVWCEDGVCKLPTDPRPDPFPYGHAQFLLDNRSDFGPNLWDKYLNPDRLTTRQMPGNHFTMMKSPHVKILGDIIREAIMTAV